MGLIIHKLRSEVARIRRNIRKFLVSTVKRCFCIIYALTPMKVENECYKNMLFNIKSGAQAIQPSELKMLINSVKILGSGDCER